MSLVSNDPTQLIMMIGLVLFGLVAAFLFWTRPKTPSGDREGADFAHGSTSPLIIAARNSVGEGRTVITLQSQTQEHVVLIGPHSDLLLESRTLSLKRTDPSANPTIPLPFPPKVDPRMMAPRAQPMVQQGYAPHPVQPVIHPVPAQSPAPPAYDPAPTYAAPPPSPVTMQPPLQTEVRAYPSAPQHAHEQAPHLTHQPAPLTPPSVPLPPFDHVFQASVNTQQSLKNPLYSPFDTVAPPTIPPMQPSVQTVAPPPAPISPVEEEIPVPAFLQNKITPHLMEQALPPEEALPPHWPDNHDSDLALTGWETPPSPAKPMHDPYVPIAAPSPASESNTDQVARQLEEALRQKLAEIHLKPTEPSQGTAPASSVHESEQSGFAPENLSPTDAAADRFEQEIRKLLGRDLKKS